MRVPGAAAFGTPFTTSEATGTAGAVIGTLTITVDEGAVSVGSETETGGTGKARLGSVLGAAGRAGCSSGKDTWTDGGSPVRDT